MTPFFRPSVNDTIQEYSNLMTTDPRTEATNKELLLTCKVCRARFSVFGKTIDDIIRQIDEAGWHDLPAINGVIQAICPTCDANADAEYGQE